ncbi:MAG: cysteine-rich CWC family protein [Spirosomataceae bacterium]
MTPASSPSLTPPTCPRCGRAFHCQPASGADCVCFQFHLPSEVTHYLRTNYDSCVCPDCLRELAHAFEKNSGVFLKLTAS